MNSVPDDVHDRLGLTPGYHCSSEGENDVTSKSPLSNDECHEVHIFAYPSNLHIESLTSWF
jgi:hypothetical protein